MSRASSACPLVPARRAVSGSASLPITAWSRCSDSCANWRTWSASSVTALTTRSSYAWRNFSRHRADGIRATALVGHPDRGPDLPELAPDLAPGLAHIIAGKYFPRCAGIHALGVRRRDRHSVDIRIIQTRLDVRPGVSAIQAAEDAVNFYPCPDHARIVRVHHDAGHEGCADRA